MSNLSRIALAVGVLATGVAARGQAVPGGPSMHMPGGSITSGTSLAPTPSFTQQPSFAQPGLAVPSMSAPSLSPSSYSVPSFAAPSSSVSGGVSPSSRFTPPTFGETLRAPDQITVGVGQTGLPVTAEAARSLSGNLGAAPSNPNGALPMGFAGSGLGQPGSLSGVPGGGDFRLDIPSNLGSLPAATGFSLGLPPTAGVAARDPMRDPSKSLAPTAAGLVPASQPALSSTDRLVQDAAAKFRDGQYREVMDMLKSQARGNASLELRELYIASLVGSGRTSMAAYEAVQAAKAYPKTFFTDPILAEVYQDNPDLAKHASSVEDISRTTTNLEPGILWALYSGVNKSNTTPPSVVLDLLDAPAADKGWYGQLKQNVPQPPSK